MSNRTRGKAIDEAVVKLLESRKKQMEAGQKVKLKEDDFKDVLDWNELWPEFMVTRETVIKRAKGRDRRLNVDRYERTLRSTPKVVRRSDTFSPTDTTGGEK